MVGVVSTGVGSRSVAAAVDKSYSSRLWQIWSCNEDSVCH